MLLLYIVADRISIGEATKKYNKIHKVTRADGSQADNAQSERENPAATEVSTYILNINTKRFHYPSCSSVDEMKDKNKQEYTGTRDELIADGYKPCGRCKP